MRQRWMRVGVWIFLLTTGLHAQEAGNASDAFYKVIRTNDLGGLQTLLKSGASPNIADPRGGATPLMYAAAVGSLDAMKLLLDRGAGVNASNGAGSTALMWAATDIDKVRLLLARKADARAATDRGRTALFIAARSDPSSEIVKLLISAGGDPKAVDAAKMTILHSAAVGNDTETIRLLVEAGLDVNAVDALGFTPLIYAASYHNIDAVKLLLARGARVDAVTAPSFNKVKAGPIGLGAWTALTTASLGPPELVERLLEAGARVDHADARGMTPLMIAVATDRQNPEVIELLLARGANVNAISRDGDSVLDWARKIGNPRIIDMLVRAGGRPANTEQVAVPEPAPADLRTAVDRGRALLGRMSAVVGSNGGCASCHSHTILEVTDRAARSKGLPIDDKAAAQRRALTRAPFLTPATLLERFDPPGSPDTTSYALYGLASTDYPPDRFTDAVAVQIMAQQARNGGWGKITSAIGRPPIEDGEISRVAVAVRAITAYGVPGRQKEIDRRIARAKAWLLSAKPTTTYDLGMQLLGLFWAGAGRSDRARVADAMLAKQRPDGGWAQTDHLASDAYATGQSLYALAEAGGIAPETLAFKKGVEYLLSSQRADGSWYVKSRSPKFQPFFDGGFPYGHDQWISAMATGWAVAALTHALPRVAGQKSTVASRQFEVPMRSRRSEVDTRKSPSQVDSR